MNASFSKPIDPATKPKQVLHIRSFYAGGSSSAFASRKFARQNKGKQCPQTQPLQAFYNHNSEHQTDKDRIAEQDSCSAGPSVSADHWHNHPSEIESDNRNTCRFGSVASEILYQFPDSEDIQSWSSDAAQPTHQAWHTLSSRVRTDHNLKQL